MMNGEPKRVVIRIRRHIPIYPHLAPAVGEIVVADRLNDPYSNRYFYVLQRAGKRVIIRPDECVEISPAEAWPELSVSGRWARLHREQSREPRGEAITGGTRKNETTVHQAAHGARHPAQ